MNCTFNSRFAKQLTAFIAQKRALGFVYENAENTLVLFDRFCAENYPVVDSLTKEICNAWAVRRDSEKATSFSNRLYPVREFARHLNRTGESAYVLSTHFAKRTPPNPPHICSEKEISGIWREFDNIKPNKLSPLKHIVFPAIVRLLYCCGLRPVEARRLTTSDVDLKTGKLFIQESKGHKDRIVMMADDVREYMMRYNDKINRLLPVRTWFFPTAEDTQYCRDWLVYEFRRLRTVYEAIRPYDLRHSFATHRLYKWLKDGTELTSVLPYLSAYMGHAHISDTYYYIHLVPEQFEIMSGLDFSKYEALLPEVQSYE